MNNVEFSHYGVLGMKWGIRKLISGKDKQKTEKKEAPKKTKEEILKTGKASEVLKIKSQITPKEMSDVVKRLQLEQQLKDFSSKEIKSSMKKIDDVMKNVKTINNWANIGTDAYNTMASIYNATENGRKKPLVKIDKQINKQTNKRTESRK